MNYKSRYITKDDFKGYWGIDLDQELAPTSNQSNDADAFLFRVTLRLITYLNARLYRDIDREYPEFTDDQKEHFKYALLEQAMYVMRNGDIATDSGYDPERGETASRGHLEKITIGTAAIDHLMLAGLWTRKIKGSRGFNIDGWWR